VTKNPFKALLPRSLQARFTFALFSLAIASCVGAGFVTAVLIGWNLEDRVEVQVRASADKLLELSFDSFAAPQEVERLHQFVRNVQSFSRADQIIRFFDETGELLYSSTSSTDVRFLDATANPTFRQLLTEVRGPNNRYFSLFEGYETSMGNVRWVQVAQALPSFKDLLVEASQRYSLILVILLFMSLLVAYLLSRHLVGPIHKVATHLAGLDPEDVRSWRAISGDAERAFLSDIIDSANALIARVQNAFFANHNLARFIAHEVRTPLTMMLGEIDLARRTQSIPKEYEAMTEQIVADIMKVDRIISTILELAQRDRGVNPCHPRALVLSEVVDRVSSDFRKAYNRPLQVFFPERERSPRIYADPDLLLLLLDNLLRNAAKHSGLTSKLSLTIAEGAAGFAHFEIADTGPGIRPEILESLNKMIVPPKTSGVGLGLPLALEIARIAGWKLKFTNINPGLKVTIEVPLQKPEDFE
jgi:signal transduction histidine kinase